MIRAVFFDFYSVWAPDKLSEYLAEAQQHGFDAADGIQQAFQNYYLGMSDITILVDTIRYKLNRPDIDPQQFVMQESDISPGVVDFMRGLHAHFVKLGVLANLGKQEYDILNSFNEHNQLFEVITGPITTKTPLLSQETFVKALQAIGEPPHSCLIVSGHDDYLRFAEGLGIATLKFEGFPKLKQALDQLLTGNA
jgi:FMN phosphatase YigB (HAD superfamily)